MQSSLQQSLESLVWTSHPQPASLHCLQVCQEVPHIHQSALAAGHYSIISSYPDNKKEPRL